MTDISDLLKPCSFQNWYDLFKKNSIRSICLPLPEDVLDYLKKDIFAKVLEFLKKNPKSSPFQVQKHFNSNLNVKQKKNCHHLTEAVPLL